MRRPEIVHTNVAISETDGAIAGFTELAIARKGSGRDRCHRSEYAVPGRRLRGCRPAAVAKNGLTKSVPERRRLHAADEPGKGIARAAGIARSRSHSPYIRAHGDFRSDHKPSRS